MPKPKPIFLFAFANDEAHSLKLSEEERSLRETLATAHDQGRIECMQLSHASLDDIFRTFNRFHNRIALFHFGGHSGAQFLNLQDTNARASSLSTLIGMQRNLQLVFLNGCGNYEQVQVLFEKGVKAVIATNAPIDDHRAFQFSSQFYYALAAGKPLLEAFNTAAAFVQNDSPELAISWGFDLDLEAATERSIKLEVDSTEDGLPWGLYTQSDADLEWKLPPPAAPPPDADYFKETPLNLPDVNKKLVLYTFEGMAECSQSYNSLFQLYQQEQNSVFFNMLQNTMLDAFPSIVSIQVRDLFTPEACTQGRVRLQEFSEAYNTLARLLSAIALSNLWEAAVEQAPGKKLAIRQNYRKDISKHLKWQPETGGLLDHFWLIGTISRIFQENGVEPYVRELVSLDESLREATEYYDAYRFLEQQLRQRLQARNIASGEVEELCREVEHHFGKLLRKCAFLCDYQLVTVKDISVDLPRREPDPVFVHQKAILKGRDYATIDRAPIRRNSTASNNSVYIARDIADDEPPLNLSPFLIDLNAFKVKKEYLPKIYFFNGLENGKLYFEHAETIDNPFIVRLGEKERQFHNLDSLFTMAALFKEDLGLK